MSVEGPEIGVRIKPSGSEEIRAALEAAGDSGVRAFERVDRAARAVDFNSVQVRATQAFASVGTAAEGAYAKVGGVLDTVAKSVGSAVEQALQLGGAYNSAGGIAQAGLSGLVSAIKTFTQSSAEAVSSVADTADSVSLGVESFSRLQSAVRLSGGDAEKFGTALGDLRRKVVSLAEGNQQAIDAFEEIGLSLADFRDGKGLRGTREQLDLVLDRLKAIASPTLQAKAAFDIFGISGRALSAIMSDGAKGLRDAEKEAERYGAVLDKALIENINESLTAQAKLSESLKGLGISLTRVFYPFFSSSADSLADWLNGSRTTIEGWLQSLVGLATKVREDVVTLFTEGLGAGLAGSMITAAGGAVKKASMVFGGLGGGDGDGEVRRQAIINGKLTDLANAAATEQAKAGNRVAEVNGKLVDLDGERAEREAENVRGQAIVNGQAITLRNRAAEAAKAANAAVADSDDELAEGEKENLAARAAEQERFAFVNGERVKLIAQKASAAVSSIGAAGGKFNFPVVQSLGQAFGVLRDGAIGVARSVTSRAFSDFLAFLGQTWRAAGQAGQSVLALGRAFASGIGADAAFAVSWTGVMRSVGNAFRDLRLGLSRGFKTEWARDLMQALRTVGETIRSLYPSTTTLQEFLQGLLARGSSAALGLSQAFAGTVSVLRSGVGMITGLFAMARAGWDRLFGGENGVGGSVSKVSMEFGRSKPVLQEMLGYVAYAVGSIATMLRENIGWVAAGVSYVLSFYAAKTDSFLLNAASWVLIAALIGRNLYKAFTFDLERSSVQNSSFDIGKVLGPGFSASGVESALEGAKGVLANFVSYVQRIGGRLVSTIAVNWGDLGTALAVSLGIFGAFTGSTKTILAGLVLAVGPLALDVGRMLLAGIDKGLGQGGGAQPAALVQKTGLPLLARGVGIYGAQAVRSFSVNWGVFGKLLTGALDVVLAFASKALNAMKSVAKALGFEGVGGLSQLSTLVNGVLLLVTGFSLLTGTTTVLIPALTLLALSFGATFYTLGIATMAANLFFGAVALGSRLISGAMLVVSAAVTLTRVLVVGAYAAMRGAALAFWAFMGLGPVAFWAGIAAIAALAALAVVMIVGNFDSIEEAWKAMCAGLVSAWEFSFTLLKLNIDFWTRDAWKFELWSTLWQGFWQSVANGGIWAWNKLKGLFGLDKILGQTSYYNPAGSPQDDYNAEMKRLGLDNAGPLVQRGKKGEAQGPAKAADPAPWATDNEVIKGDDGVMRLKSEEMRRLQDLEDERYRMRILQQGNDRDRRGAVMEASIAVNGGMLPGAPVPKAEPNLFDRLRSKLPSSDALGDYATRLLGDGTTSALDKVEGLTGGTGIDKIIRSLRQKYQTFGLDGLIGREVYDDTLIPGQRSQGAFNARGEGTQYEAFDNQQFHDILNRLAVEHPDWSPDRLMEEMRRIIGSTNRTGNFPGERGTAFNGLQFQGVHPQPDFKRGTEEDRRSPVARSLQDRLMELLPDRSLGPDAYGSERQIMERLGNGKDALPGEREDNTIERQASYRPGGGMDLSRLLAAFGGLGSRPAMRTAYASGPVRASGEGEEPLTPGERAAARDRASEAMRKMRDQEHDDTVSGRRSTVVAANVSIQPGDKRLYGNREAFDALFEMLGGVGMRGVIDQPRTT